MFLKRKSWKKRTRGNCEAEASPPKKNQNSEDPSGSIRDITAHLIHDKNTSIALSCTVFNFPSAGNDPGWIYWSYEFLFFRPRGLRTQRPAQTGPGGQNLRFPRFDPMILCSFLATIRWATLENYSSKQMMVYDQITFFIKFSICLFVFDLKHRKMQFCTRFF